MEETIAYQAELLEKAYDKVTELNAKLTRYGAALKKIADYPHPFIDHIKAIAKEALENK